MPDVTVRGKRGPRSINAALLIASSGYFILSRLDAFWSSSTDLAFHTLLVSRHMETFNIANVTDPPLGNMVQFPQFSYLPAAIFGRLAGSPVIGIEIATLSALVLLWVFGAFAAQTVPAGIAPAFLVVFASLSVLNDASLRLELFGNEIAGGFFYAQLVGQAVVAGVLLASLLMELRGTDARWRYLLLFAAIALLVNIHLIPTVEMLGFLFLTVALDALQASPPGRGHLLAEGGVAIVAALAFVLVDPAFASAVANSGNDGGFPLRYTPRPYLMAILALLVAALSAAAALAWARWLDDEGRRQWSYIKVLSVFGLSVAGCCLGQYLALQAGYGSSYAVRKYAFALNTTLLLLLALGIAARITLVLNRRRASQAFFSARTSYTLACLAPLALIFSAVYPPKGEISVSQLAAEDEWVRAYRASTLEASPDKSDYVLGKPGVRNIGSFLVSIDALHVPIDGNALAALDGKPMPEPSRVRYIFTSQGAVPWDMPECRKFTSSAGFVVVDGTCAFARSAGLQAK
jgi:hypothetical protein